jgi:DNA-binding CsgD family transcriptional regulator/N-acetylneuraminic acid mutarotase
MDDAVPAVSEREIEVLQLVATGATNQEIARDLVISINTVKVHLRNIFEKLGVQSRTEAALYAIRQGWVEVDGGEALAEPAPSEEASTAPAESAALPSSVGWWQRLYALAAVLLAVLLLLLPALQTGNQAIALSSPISDQPMSGSTSLRAETSRWMNLAGLPTPRTRLAMVAYQDRLYAIGGDQETGVTGQTEIYSPQTDSWSIGATKPTAVSNVGAVVVDERIYVPGGCIGLTGVTNHLEVYDPSSNTWTQASPMPIPLCAYATATVDDKIYLFGGWDGQQFVDRVFVYDPGDDAWTELRRLPSARGFAAAGAIEHTIYVVGGYDGLQEFADTYAYDTDQDTWAERAPMSVGRGGLGVAVMNNKLYAIGGGWDSYLATNERYDPVSDTWTLFESPVVGEWRNLGVAALGTQIYAVGGWNGAYTNTTEAYQAIFRIILPVAR